MVQLATHEIVSNLAALGLIVPSPVKRKNIKWAGFEMRLPSFLAKPLGK